MVIKDSLNELDCLILKDFFGRNLKDFMNLKLLSFIFKLNIYNET